MSSQGNPTNMFGNQCWTFSQLFKRVLTKVGFYDLCIIHTSSVYPNVYKSSLCQVWGPHKKSSQGSPHKLVIFQSKFYANAESYK